MIINKSHKKHLGCLIAQLIRARPIYTTFAASHAINI